MASIWDRSNKIKGNEQKSLVTTYESELKGDNSLSHPKYHFYAHH